MYDAEALAVAALDGVGDAALGEWRTPGEVAYHVRRRLSTAEAIGAGLSVRDLRGTPEGVGRLRKLLTQCPYLRPHAVQIGELPA